MSAIVFLCAGSAAAGDGAIDEMVTVLHAQGLIDDMQRDQILVKHYSEQTKAHAAPDVSQGLSGFEWFGDLRLRYEAFHYDKPSFGRTPNSDDRGGQDSRERLRYRVRFGFKKPINDWATAVVRLATGDSSAGNTTNNTLGSGDDFDPDDIFINWAYGIIELPEVGAVQSKLHAGKIPNPFMWKRGKDLLIWDGDFTLEGVGLLSEMKIGEGTRLFLNTGYFVADEETDSKDPKVVGLQLGAETSLADGVAAGLRASGYEWRGLDTSFIVRSLEQGNLAGAFDSRARIGEVAGFLKLGQSDRWPVLLYGTAVRNLLADSTVHSSGVSVDEEDFAWGAGVEVGSSSEWFKLGAGFFEVEANAVVAQFMDSDLFDGFTNRKGWIVYGSKKVARGTEVSFTFFDGDSLKNTGGAAGPFFENLSPAAWTTFDRKRLQTNLIFKF